MGVRHRLILAAVSLAATSAACKPKDPPKNDQKPPDHLAPTEVVEGKERAFGLPLPRTAHVQARFARTVHVTTPLTPEDLSNFVRARVKEGQVVPGSTSTRLDNVVPRADATKRISVEVRTLRLADGTRSEMIVRDTTPPPTEPGLSDEERWRRAGMRPDGTLLDPKQLQ